MLEFNDEHKGFKESLKNNDGKIKVRNAVICGLTILSMFLFSGCAKNVDCDIEDLHAHIYTNEDALVREVMSEREHIGDFFRTDQYVIVDKEASKLIEFENDEGLFKIEDNISTIEGIASVKEDYTEYRYSYITMVSVPHVVKSGTSTIVTYTHVPVKKHSWTTDSNHRNLTGEERVVHHMYKGYKIVTNANGDYEVVESELVDDINDLPSEYKYVKEDFCVKVNLDDKTVEISYEDGKEEEQEIQLTEQEQMQYELEMQNSQEDVVDYSLNK